MSLAKRRLWPVLTLTAFAMSVPVGALLLGAGLAGGMAAGCQTGATLTVPAVTVAAVSGLDAAQLAVAGTIIAVGQSMHVPSPGLLVALITAREEQGLRNDPSGSQDSLGALQQRPSQGWGTPAQIMDLAHASRSFYTHLLAVPGWQSMAPTVAAQSVQASGFPDAYAQWVPLAQSILTKAGVAPATAATVASCTQVLAATTGGVAGYVNPIQPGGWTPQRTDQGVDWAPNGSRPVLAIGDGVVTYSNAQGSGWPGGAFIAYQLTAGSHAGLYIFVAEDLTALTTVGTVVKAGQQIATALPRGGSGTEWGFAAPPGTTSSVATPYNGAPDGTAMPGGKAFARFLIELGAHPAMDPGPGADRP